MDGLSEKLVVALICMIGFFTANSLTAPVALLLVYFCLSAAVILIPQKYSAVSAGLIAAGAAAGLLFPLALCALPLLTIGYSYQTAYANRKALLASITGVSMGTKTGSKTIDITSIVQAYCRDGQTEKFHLWGYGTGGSTSNSNFRGYNPDSSYSSQRPYITLVYDTSKARIFTNGAWETAVPYVYHNGIWQPAQI